MATVEELIQELEQETHATRRLLERIPENHMEWQPHPKSMTLGELAMHVASIPGALAEVSTRPFDVGTPIPRPSANSVDQLLESLSRSVARAIEILRSMGDRGLEDQWQMLDGDRELWSLPRGAFLRTTMLNHWYHHRGQLTVYLRQLGIPLPAVYGDSADEKMAAAMSER
ncbi:MAG TPA: DinB family protein [Gemmatimonadales bacterium]|nr:DinB family protein [Gemmatimonadales bacterium]